METSPPRKPPLIRLEDVTIRVGARHILQHTDWEIQPDENWAVLGPNGAGKSTLMAALAGRLPVVAGRVQRFSTASEPRFMGYVALDQQREMLAREAIAADARAFSGRHGPGTTVGAFLNSDIPSSRQRRIWALMGLKALYRKALGRLSSGEWRRLLIARALLPGPRLLLLDEPFDGLDRSARQRLTRALHDLMQGGVQVVMATHCTDELPRGISHVIRLAAGRVTGVEPLTKGSLESLTVVQRREPNRCRPLPAPTSMDVPPVLVELRNVTIRYGATRILDRLTWRHQRGEHWAVMGPNGAGKTTLLRLIAADHPQAYANDVRVMGRQRGPGETIRDTRAPVGWISSEILMQHQRPMPVMDVVLSGFFDSVGLYRRPTAAQQQLAGRWLARIDMPGAAATDFRHLSGGQQRLVLLARAMVKMPVLLILDEPCEGLDPDNRQRVLSWLDGLARQGRTHLLYVTHRRQDLPASINHILHLDPGAGARQERRPSAPKAEVALHPAS